MPSPQNTGLRQSKLTLLVPNSGIDSYGQPKNTFTAQTDLWAVVEALGGRELASAQTVNPEINYRIAVRYQDVAVQFEGGTLVKCWLKQELANGTKYYDIEAPPTPDQRNQWVNLLCIERVGRTPQVV